MKTSQHEPDSQTCDVVWDHGRLATVCNAAGHELKVGEEGEWPADRLFSVALQSALLSGFLGLAKQADLQVLGYVSSGDVRCADHPGHEREFLLTPCIVVGSQRDRERALKLVHQAAAGSHLCQLLGTRMALAPQIVVVSSQAAGPDAP